MGGKGPGGGGVRCPAKGNLVGTVKALGTLVQHSCSAFQSLGTPLQLRLTTLPPPPHPSQATYYDGIPEDTAAQAGGATGFVFLICLLANSELGALHAAGAALGQGPGRVGRLSGGQGLLAASCCAWQLLATASQEIGPAGAVAGSASCVEPVAPAAGVGGAFEFRC